jgi:S1-C subfamily serine protease
MSAETEPEEKTKALVPVLRREALLPNERGRGLGTVAVVCTMAGVASGLALATTLMAMQVADSMSIRNCPYRIVPQEVQAVDLRADHGFLGIRYDFHDGIVDVHQVLHGTPAETVDLRAGDHILSIDGMRMHSTDEVQEHILDAHAGTTATIVYERHGVVSTVHPTLMARRIAF